MQTTPTTQNNVNKQFKIALMLAVATIVLAALEAFFSTYFGYADENLTLFGFGIDSAIEVISGIGIAHMVLRIMHHPESSRDRFEKTALQITGACFYFLVLCLTLGAVASVLNGHKPTATTSGIVIALISIICMYGLIYGKTKIGKRLNSKAILADAACTKVCIYMSLILLSASMLYSFIHIGYFDSAGAIGLAYLSFREGNECFEKAKK